ncbi:hypothetical protein GF340_06095 [Candidatus Peregrinibacteria bacterium]|nr:hypothetical protein [Candidatus Peregrinibacteria bacterium]
MVKISKTCRKAAEATGFPESQIPAARERVARLSKAHKKKVQYWLLLDELEWGSTREETHLRLFAATRLLYEYEEHGSETSITQLSARKGKLRELIEKLTKRLLIWEQTSQSAPPH